MLTHWLDTPKAAVQVTAALERLSICAEERTYLDEMRSAPFTAYRWGRTSGSTRTGHPLAGRSASTQLVYPVTAAGRLMH